MKYVPAWTLFTHLRALTSLHGRRDMTAAVLENNLIRDLTAQPSQAPNPAPYAKTTCSLLTALMRGL